MKTYQEFVKDNDSSSLTRQSENAFVAYCKKYKIAADQELIKRMTLNVGFDLLRQKYVLNKLNYFIDLLDLEILIQGIVQNYYRRLR